MKTDSQSGTKSPWNEKGKTFLFLSNPRKLKSVINQRAMFSLKYKLLLIRRFWFSNQWKFVPTLWPISFLRTCFLPLANQILRVLLQAFFCRKTYLFFLRSKKELTYVIFVFSWVINENRNLIPFLMSLTRNWNQNLVLFDLSATTANQYLVHFTNLSAKS